MGSGNKKSKGFLICISGLFLSLLFLVMALPSILSTSWGTNQLNTLINRYVPGTIEIKTLQLSWLGPQKAEGIHIKDPSDNSVLTIDSFSSDAPLWSAFRQKLNRGFIFINGLNATIIEEHHGITNLQKALVEDSGPSSRGPKLQKPFKIALSNVTAKLNVTSAHDPVTINLKGETKQEDLEGNFDVNVLLNNIPTNEWLSQDSNNELALHANINNFPIALIDHFIALKRPELAGIATAALGKTLNLTAQNTISSSNILFTLQTSAPTFFSNLNGQVVNGKLSLNQQGTVSVVITPEFALYLNRLTKEKIELLKPAKANLAIQKLEIPLFATLDELIDQLSLIADLNIEQTAIAHKEIPSPIEFRQFKAHLEIPQNAKAITAQLQGDILQTGDPTHLNLLASFDKPRNLNRLIEQFYDHFEMKAELQNIPVDLIDHMLGMKTTLATALGQKANLTAQTLFKDQHADLTLAFNSEKINIPAIYFKLNQELSLQRPVALQYRLDATTAEKLGLQLPGFTSQEDLQVQLQLNQLSIPVPNLTAFLAAPIPLLKESSLRSTLTLSPMTFTSPWGSVATNGFIAEIQGDNFADMQCNLSLNVQGTDLVDSLIGKSGHFNLSLARDQVKAEWASPLLKGALRGRISRDGHFSMLDPMTILYTLTPESAQFLGLTETNILKLDRPVTVRLTAQPLKLPIKLEQLATPSQIHTLFSGQIAIDELPLTYHQQSKAAIRNLSLPWELDTVNNRIKIGIHGTTQLAGSKDGSLKGDALITDWIKSDHFNFKESNIQANLQLNALPVVFLGALLQQNELVEILGSTLDVNLSVVNSKSPMLNVILSGDNLRGEAALVLGDAIELQSQPATLHATFTPERFHALRLWWLKSQGKPLQDNLALSASATLTASISSLHIPANWTSAALKGNLMIDKLNVFDTQRKQGMNLQNVVAQIDTQHLAKQIQFHISASEKGVSNGSESTFSGILENSFTPDGKLNTKDLSLQFEGKSRRMPAGLLCHMACAGPEIRNKVEALFGPTIDADLKAALRHMSGPIQAFLQGKNGHISIDAQLNEGVLTLNRPAEIEVAVTPQLGKSILQDVIPILGGAISAQKPIKITLDPTDFALPLRNWDINQIHIGQATIDLGKIQFTNEGDLGNVVSLLKHPSHDTLSVWFTPLYLNMAEGVLRLERMDMLLVDRYPIAIWGKINFPKDKVDLLIGITGSALSQALNMQGLESDYMLQLPYKGPIGEASIDKTKATARISALVAQSQGGPHGMILGTVLDIAGGGLSEKAPPESTTRPLPWDATHKPSASDTAEHTPHPEKSKHKEKSHDELKALEKGASKLINSLFH